MNIEMDSTLKDSITLFIFKDLIFNRIYTHVSVRGMCMCMCECRSPGSQKRVLDLLELEF